MRVSKPQTSSSPGRFLSVGIWILLAIAILSTGGILISGYRNVETFKSLGSWGDFTGGLLNPILTFITFLAVLLTLWLQRQELVLTRDEMIRSADALERQDASLKKQSFENTFFEMLKLHNSIVESIDLANLETGAVTKGRDAFNIFYNRFTKIYRANFDKSNGRNSKLAISELSYFIFWKEARTELGHYFRFLFNFFRFIEKSGIEDSFYVKLLILFYNNISANGKAFGHYAKLYELFDNLPVERLLDREHSEFADKKAYGNNSMDFKPYVPSMPRTSTPPT